MHFFLLDRVMFLFLTDKHCTFYVLKAYDGWFITSSKINMNKFGFTLIW